MLALTEELPCGGILRVTLNDWNITYYIEGPDKRYKPTVYTVNGLMIERYISSLQKNFSEYERLKEILANEESFSKSLDFGMSIYITKKVPAFSGLHLASHKQPISTGFQMKMLVENYTNAIERAKRMQELLKKL
ncbi:hypothetical protein GJ700_17695 [Duganella sp. FT92W]|uniref:Uncharacterized protein n=1 Tax=Pseudoduganella rivuli TaxID=2666085 RepID=A0A7X2IPA8_9BURK|nr:hypothetical protein [Pseudoduganella rivuli]MRV73549.1 hypothetical protein [Pseudoduganella rivuli]